MERVRISMVCMNSRLGDIAGNSATILKYARLAKETGSDIVCFPEMSLTGYSMPRSLDYALSPDSPEVKRIVEASRDLNLCIIFGFAEVGGHITQAVAENGELLGIYRKTHLGQNEKNYASPGDSLPVFRTSKATIGIQLCLESHFPEISGTYATKGADIIFMPHASGLNPERRRLTWNKVLPARSYDNTVFVATCNQVGDNGIGTVFTGGAAILDVRGDIIAEDYSGECILTADLDGKLQHELRTDGNRDMRSLYFLNRRRPDIYFR